MRSTVIQTIHDFTNVLYSFDIMGIDSKQHDVPLDEYVHEAVSIFYHFMRKPHDIDADTNEQIVWLAVIAHFVFAESFTPQAVMNVQHDLWHQVATALFNAWKSNVEISVAQKKGSR